MAEHAPAVAEPDRRRSERIRFCSRCAAPAAAEPPERPQARRVCNLCGLGVLLECAPESRGALGAFFLVVRGDLRVSAISRGAEEIFGPEHAVVGASLEALVRCPLGEEWLARTVRGAVRGAREAIVVPLVPVGERAAGFGPLEGYVSTCGPPRAALVAVEPAVA